jgi:DNA-3-methyladenine glycosylase
MKSQKRSSPALAELKNHKLVPPSFFQRPAPLVAKELIGKYLLVKEKLLVKIIETEAYLEKEDPASHSFCGVTERNQVMFRTGGFVYVYLIYGMHHCLNFVTGREGEGQAVLLRAALPVYGLETLIANRGLPKEGSHKMLMNGPGKLTQALGVDRRMNGKTLERARLEVYDSEMETKVCVSTTPRIGISKAKDLLFRFVLSN